MHTRKPGDPGTPTARRRTAPDLGVILQTGGKLAAPVVLVLACWTLTSNLSLVNPALFPHPLEVAAALRDLLLSGTLLGDVFWSLRRALLGLLCGGALGLVVGTLTGRISALNWLLSPIFNGCRALPPVAIVPLVVVWAGLGEPAKVFITTWAAFFPVWLNTHAGVSSVDRMIIWAARSLGARRQRLLFAVTFPAALPQILVGLRLAISTCIICVVVAEATGAFAGLGYRLQISYLVFRVDRMIACMVVLAILGAVSDRLFAFATRRAFPWIALTQDNQ